MASILKVIGAIVVFFAFVLFVTCLAFSSNDEEGLASHERARCEDSQCYDEEYDYDYGNKGDNSRNRERGAFSPGPFDRSPVDIHDNYVCISPNCERKDDGRQREPEQPVF